MGKMGDLGSWFRIRYNLKPREMDTLTTFSRRSWMEYWMHNRGATVATEKETFQDLASRFAKECSKAIKTETDRNPNLPKLDQEI